MLFPAQFVPNSIGEILEPVPIYSGSFSRITNKQTNKQTDTVGQRQHLVRDSNSISRLLFWSVSLILVISSTTRSSAVAALLGHTEHGCPWCSSPWKTSQQWNLCWRRGLTRGATLVLIMYRTVWFTRWRQQRGARTRRWWGWWKRENGDFLHLRFE